MRAQSMARRLRRLLPRGASAKRPRQDVEAQLAQLSTEDRRIVEHALPYTMTGIPRLQALVDAVRYCVHRGVPGAFAECGVWRGGSVLAMILTLQELGNAEREIHLYDTFEGMTAPTEYDVSRREQSAVGTWNDALRRGERPWADVFGSQAFDEASVRDLVLSTGYPRHLVTIVRGPVEETIPQHAPDHVALLRLDTDWYESTRHELQHLYPRLVTAGVLIIDDYGHWEGARRAVDEYFAAGDPLLFHRIDYTGRMAVRH